MPRTTHLLGGRNVCDTSTRGVPADDPRTWQTDFRLLEAVSGPESILSVTVDGVEAALDATTPLPDAVTVRLAEAPAPGSAVSITHKSAMIDGET